MRLRAAGAVWFACAVAACTPGARVPPQATLSAGPVCRVGPDGGPLLAERGIGGTGAPVTQVAERGIGGTGIIGVVTGFASICLAGHEVALPADVPVEIGGAAADQQALRAGQVAAVEAAGPADALYARRVTVRYEVQGPVEAVASDRLQVAGQTVLLSAETWLRTAPAVGQWVAVSGLRDASGAIAATRLDLVSTRTFIVHGVVRQDLGGYRIGTLPIVPGPGDVLVPGLPVSVTGVYDEGSVRAASVAPDLFAADPVAYFGGAASSFIVEGFTRPGRRSVVEFQRNGGESIRANPVAPSEGAGGRLQRAPLPARDGAVRSYEPAPVPNRSLGFGSAVGGGMASRRNDGGRGAGFRPQAGWGPGGDSGTPTSNAPSPGNDGGGRRPFPR